MSPSLEGPDSNVPTGPLDPNCVGMLWYSTCQGSPYAQGARWDQWAERPHFRWALGFPATCDEAGRPTADRFEPRKFVAKSPVAAPSGSVDFRYGYVNPLQGGLRSRSIRVWFFCCGPWAYLHQLLHQSGFGASACRALRLDRHLLGGDPWPHQASGRRRPSRIDKPPCGAIEGVAPIKMAPIVAQRERGTGEWRCSGRPGPSPQRRER